ncbi:PiggyBac transposable element-derived protein 1 [Collichthys lucidus]|uniref:PiggyBac transposable element-derived protein 1 n=1 Tax=Collichthys lucidus TaxID=240159 RepID=A0A4V6XYL3_COLLU|nr:PiggyBac transposable element-derived protein 1 [Collichthys lucidus]
MGGVDLLDSLIALYRTKVRSKKWYHRLVFHFLDMVITTTWLLYRRDCEGSGMGKKEEMKLYTFKSYVAEGLCKSGKSLEKKRGRHSLSIAGAYKETGDKGRCRVPQCSDTEKNIEMEDREDIGEQASEMTIQGDESDTVEDLKVDKMKDNVKKCLPKSTDEQIEHKGMEEVDVETGQESKGVEKHVTRLD